MHSEWSAYRTQLRSLSAGIQMHAPRWEMLRCNPTIPVSNVKKCQMQQCGTLASCGALCSACFQLCPRWP